MGSVGTQTNASTGYWHCRRQFNSLSHIWGWTQPQHPLPALEPQPKAKDGQSSLGSFFPYPPATWIVWEDTSLGGAPLSAVQAPAHLEKPTEVLPSGWPTGKHTPAGPVQGELEGCRKLLGSCHLRLLPVPVPVLGLALDHSIPLRAQNGLCSVP